MHLQLSLFHSSCWHYSNLVLNLSSICLFCSKQSVAEGFFFPLLFQEHKRICLLCFNTLILPWFLGFKLYLAMVLWWILQAVQSLCYNIKPPAQDCEGPVILLKKKKKSFTWLVWELDLWDCAVLSWTKMLTVDPLSPVCRMRHPCDTSIINKCTHGWRTPKSKKKKESQTL